MHSALAKQKMTCWLLTSHVHLNCLKVKVEISLQRLHRGTLHIRCLSVGVANNEAPHTSGTAGRKVMQKSFSYTRPRTCAPLHFFRLYLFNMSAFSYSIACNQHWPFQYIMVQVQCTPPGQKTGSTPSLSSLSGEALSCLCAPPLQAYPEGCEAEGSKCREAPARDWQLLEDAIGLPLLSTKWNLKRLFPVIFTSVVCSWFPSFWIL